MTSLSQPNGLTRWVRPYCVTGTILLLLLRSSEVRSQDFTYATNNGTVAITRYIGPGGAVTIPGTVGSLPVTGIGAEAFLSSTIVTSVTIPDSVTYIGYAAFQSTSLGSVIIPESVTNIDDYAFNGCPNLTNLTILDSHTAIGQWAFQNCQSLQHVSLGLNLISIGAAAFAGCTSLTNLTIPDSVTGIQDGVFELGGGIGAFTGCASLTNVAIPEGVARIGYYAFSDCQALTSITIPRSVTDIGFNAFDGCTNLSAVYFSGDAPGLEWDVVKDMKTTIYYLPGTMGWGSTFGGFPTALWQPQFQIDDLGARTNGFGFSISWASAMTVVLEASTNLTNPTWIPLATNTLSSGWSYFRDPQWTDYPARFYRVRVRWQ